MALNIAQKSFYRDFSKHGTGDAVIEITPKEIALLTQLAYVDINQKNEKWFNKKNTLLIKRGFYFITPNDILKLDNINEEDTAQAIVDAIKAIEKGDNCKYGVFFR